MLVTTPDVRLPVDPSAVVFHRLIVDESHFLDTDKKAGASAWGARQLDFLKSIQAPHVWCVTGTPFALQGGRLTFRNQLALLGHDSEGLSLGERPLTDRIVSDLKRLIIRHAKSQQIHGEAALALPEASLETVLLPMPPDERTLYRHAACVDGLPDWLHPQFPRPWVSEQPAALSRGIQARLRCCANDFALPCNREWRGHRLSYAPTASASASQRPHPPEALEAYTRLVGVRAMEKARQRAEWSKMKALLAELSSLRAADPLARVVVFTQVRCASFPTAHRTRDRLGPASVAACATAVVA